MLVIVQSNSFRRDAKRISKTNPDWLILEEIILKLAKQEKLDVKNRDHLLVGNWKGYRECHISPNWLLIYRIENNELLLVRTGSHAELF